MKAVIMAGGKGTRLESITKGEIPKPMVPILGRPLLCHQIDRLKENGITDITFVIGHLGNKIKEYFGDGAAFGIHADYIEEKEPLGTAGSFYYLKDRFEEGYFLLIFGDLYFDIDIKRMESYHKERNALATLFVHPNSHPYDSDVIVADDDGKIIDFDSKNNIRDYWYDNLVNAGIYIISNELISRIEKPIKIDLEKDILSKAVKAGENIYAYRSSEYVRDIGTVERIIQSSKEIETGFTARRNLNNKQRAIFIDRDGTINYFRGHVVDDKDFELMPGVAAAIKKINKSGLLAIVISNQPGVARGLCELKDIDNVNNKMKTLLGKDGAYLDDCYYCPHHPDKGYPEENPAYKIDCDCRKPKIGLVERAAKQYNIDLSSSWIVGDTTRDIQTGINAGCKTILVKTGEAGEDRRYDVRPTAKVDDLFKAINYILDKEGIISTL